MPNTKVIQPLDLHFDTILCTLKKIALAFFGSMVSEGAWAQLAVCQDPQSIFQSQLPKGKPILCG